MKRKILLADDSLTVQKVISLTLDKAQYELIFARNRKEVLKAVASEAPELILISDTLTDLQWQSFPKELEAWLGRGASVPALILVCARDISEAKHYAAVLRKPFSPQELQMLVANHLPTLDIGGGTSPDSLQGLFNQNFSDESALVDATLENLWETPMAPMREQTAPPKPESVGELWGASVSTGQHRETVSSNSGILDASDSLAYKATLENQVQGQLEGRDLEMVVERVLDRMLPPIVERLVNERLEKLLREQEEALLS